MYRRNTLREIITEFQYLRGFFSLKRIVALAGGAFLKGSASLLSTLLPLPACSDLEFDQKFKVELY